MVRPNGVTIFLLLWLTIKEEEGKAEKNVHARISNHKGRMEEQEIESGLSDKKSPSLT